MRFILWGVRSPAAVYIYVIKLYTGLDQHWPSRWCLTWEFVLLIFFRYLSKHGKYILSLTVNKKSKYLWFSWAVVVHSFNPNTKEVGSTDRWVFVSLRPTWSIMEFQDRQDCYTEKPYLKNPKERKERKRKDLGMVVNYFNFSTQETEAGRPLWGLSDLQNELQPSQNYIVRPCLK